ncbi:MJ1255/VC2487 family glycosyltransferase [Photobacterium alginatilyticum]|uniref:MJ1255/VC2487 family glycosyltransferase n=1 Tax=Photobacterium alginatilyticum TaxID=1775171 RepID=UPI004068F4F0
MKILYGVQGTGNGHISRAREMARAFSQLDVEVDYLFSGRPPEHYFDMACFGNFQTRRGLTFVTENGQLNQWKTVTQNHPAKFLQDVRAMDLSQYDVVLNDFEPVTAWAAKMQQVHSIGISHQSAFLYPVPKKGEGWNDRLITRHFAPTSQQLGLHWHHFGHMILPPIVPPTHSSHIGNDGSVLVYLPFEELGKVLALLSRFSQQHFYCYHPAAAYDQELENISIRALNRESFHYRLQRCAGVIANGGFELPSEAIGLGKKLLLKPLQGQYEQQSNVATLEQMGLAMSMVHLDPSAVRLWLDTDAAGVVKIPDVAQAIARWVIAGDWYNCDELWQRLWQQVEFPDLVHDLMVEFDSSQEAEKRIFSITGTY